MRRPSRRGQLVVLLAVALATPGCLSEPAPEDPTEQPGLQIGEAISARTAIDRAQAWAQATWANDTEVLLASGIEAAPGSSALQSSQDAQGDRYRIAADQALGDGRIALWLFHLWSPSTELTKTVAVSSVDVEVFDPDGSTPRNDPTTLGTWHVDSTEAAETAMAQDEFETVSQAEDGVIFHTLGPRGGRPVWQLRANSHEAGVNAWDFIDAETGESYTTGQGPGPRETHRVIQGNLTDQVPEARHGLNLSQGHDTVQATLAWDRASNNTTVPLDLLLEGDGTELPPEETRRSNRSVSMTWTNLTRPLELVVTGPEDQAWSRVNYTISVATLDDPNR